MSNSRSLLAVRRAQAGALIEPMATAIRSTPVIVAAAAFVLAVHAIGLRGEGALGTTRLWMLVLAVTVGAILHDPAASTIDAVPAPRLYRRAMRVAVAIAGVAIGWVVVLGAARDSVALPAGGLTLELLALAAVGLAGAAFVAGRRFDMHPGAAGGICVLIVVMTNHLMPQAWDMQPGALDPQWGPSRVRWAAVLALSVAVLAYVSRDPARRRHGRAVVGRSETSSRHGAGT